MNKVYILTLILASITAIRIVISLKKEITKSNQFTAK